MKAVKTTREFELHYKARIAKNEALQRAFRVNLNAFLEDRTLVDDHQLEGKMNSFGVFGSMTSIG